MQPFRYLAVAVIVAAAIAACQQQPEGNRATQNVSQAEDPFLWLEDVHGEKSMDLVKQQNTKAMSVLATDADYRNDYDDLLTVLDATDRIHLPRLIISMPLTSGRMPGAPKAYGDALTSAIT
jgi:hypothetical protein